MSAETELTRKRLEEWADTVEGGERLAEPAAVRLYRYRGEVFLRVVRLPTDFERMPRALLVRLTEEQAEGLSHYRLAPERPQPADRGRYSDWRPRWRRAWDRLRGRPEPCFICRSYGHGTFHHPLREVH